MPSLVLTVRPCQTEGVVARTDYGFPACEWHVGPCIRSFTISPAIADESEGEPQMTSLLSYKSRRNKELKLQMMLTNGESAGNVQGNWGKFCGNLKESGGHLKGN